MDILSIILIAIGLAMDCFAVSIASGLRVERTCLFSKPNRPILMAVLFGVFQGGMPLIGYYAGTLFANFFSRFSPWIALVLLSSIGGKMIWESFHENVILCALNKQRCSKHNAQCEFHGNKAQCPYHVHPSAEEGSADFSLRNLLLLAVATSIDALATGVIFIPVPEMLWIGVGIIALVSFLLSMGGYLIGVFVGAKFHFNVGLLGGIILILIGLKIFIEGVFLS